MHLRAMVGAALCAAMVLSAGERLWGAAPAPTEESYDIIVAGAGTGGTSAAIEAARHGARVALLEESDWIGGQMTAAGVSTMDEGLGPRSTPPSGFYAEYLNRMREFYQERGKSIGTCYWASNTHCFDPRAARDMLNRIIDEVNSGRDGSKGHIDVYLDDRVVRVLADGDAVTGVVTSKEQTFHSKVLIDATEYGDVLPLTPARYRSGNTMGPDNGNSCIQSITWVGVIRKYPQGVPPDLQMHDPPPGYGKWLPELQASMRKDGNPVNRSLPVSFPLYAAYRGIPDLASPLSYTATDPREITRTSMDWFNDFDATTELYDRSTRKRMICAAKMKTLANLYYIQHDMGETLWSVADDEGYDTSYNRDHSCEEIPEEFKKIENNLPQIPYVRESNRLVGEYTLTAGDIRRESEWAISVKGFADAIAVGNYADDLHGCNSSPKFFESDLEHITDLPPGFRFGAFQVPLRSLIPEKVDGLLAAEKNISQSRLANGATRLQPITMLTGQAAGLLAAIAVGEHVQPRQVSPDQVQIGLLREGDILARPNMTGLRIGSKPWQAAQFAVVHRWITMGHEGGFMGNSVVTRAEGATILATAFGTRGWNSPGVANTGDFDPMPRTLVQVYRDVPLYDPIFNAVSTLHEAGAAPPCPVSPTDFCPSYTMSIGEFAHAAVVMSEGGSGSSGPSESETLAGIGARADEPLTREDAAVILYNLAVLHAEQTSPHR